ncbi:MAG: hypothetical protein U0573_00095 [Phycisphaerales bacterium]|nr:hypothetical protein [Planctomycetota bacterium]
MRDGAVWLAALVCAAGSTRALGQFQGFTPLKADALSLRQFQATCISGDGKTVAGYAFAPGDFSQFFPVRFQASGPQNLGLYSSETRARSYGVNANGTFVVGGGDSEGFWWVPPGPNVGSETAPLLDVNDDGSVFITSTTRYEGLDSPSPIPNLPGYTSLAASRLGASGNAIALTCHFFEPGSGYGYPFTPDVNIDQASRWTSNGGTEPLGFLPGGTNSFAVGISADGSVVVGRSEKLISPGNIEQRPFRWSGGGGMQEIPMISGAGGFGEAMDASADGSVIVGQSDGQAFMWDAVHGTRSIQQVLASHGHDTLGWTLVEATAISDDGTIVAGIGINPDLQTEGWVANLTDVCTPPGSVGEVSLGVVAVEGGAATGTDQNFGSVFTANDLTSSGVVAFDTSLANGVGACYAGVPGVLSLAAIANGSPFLAPSLLRLSGSGKAALRDSRFYSQPFPNPPLLKFVYFGGALGSLSVVAESGGVAPGTGGGTFDPQPDFSSSPFLNGVDSYGFQSRIAGGNTSVAAFATVGNVLSRVGVSLPPPATSLANPTMTALTDSGTVVRTGRVDLANGPKAILAGGPPPENSTMVAKVGDHVPGEANGVAFTDLRDVLAEGDEVMFAADYGGGGFGLFRGGPSAVSAVAKIGSTVDGLPGRVITAIETGRGMALMPDGSAVFVARVTDAISADVLTLVKSGGGERVSLMRSGETKLPGYDICRVVREFSIVAVDGGHVLLTASPTIAAESGMYVLSDAGLTLLAQVGQLVTLGEGEQGAITQINPPGGGAMARTGRDGRGTFLKDHGAVFAATVNAGISKRVLLRAAFYLPTTCPADLNSDGLVDDSDFSIFVVAYNMLDCADPLMPPACASDLNRDGVVEDADFSIFVVAYNELLCP